MLLTEHIEYTLNYRISKGIAPGLLKILPVTSLTWKK